MKLKKIKPKTRDDQFGAIGPKSGKEKIYPTFRIHTDHVPELTSDEVGSEHEIHMRAKLVGLSKSQFQNEAEFEIHHIGTESAEDKNESGHESDAEDKKKDGESEEDKNESGRESDKRDKGPEGHDKDY